MKLDEALEVLEENRLKQALQAMDQIEFKKLRQGFANAEDGLRRAIASILTIPPNSRDASTTEPAFRNLKKALELLSKSKLGKVL